MVPEKALKILLWFIALHSFFTGVFLIVGSRDWFLFVGFPYHGGFFSVQGGVFHLVMVVAYLMTAYHLSSQHFLIWFCISAKFMATVFLALYYFLYEPIVIVLLSGIGDFLMGVLLFLFYIRYKQSNHA
jgi:hypothetical protein